ncbi:MAG: DUF3990 domain-containing protein [Muribaculaceae bacterium]|nr:DUF3990 domain-containing protein [Muribaculaceae bacterium]
MKVLYHGGLEVITSPEIRTPNRTLDFGAGFYLTTSENQARDWVARRLRNDITTGFVNCYDFSISDACKDLNVKIFEAPTEEWLDFVMSNRRIVGFEHDYDVVAGPVANDRVYTAFSLYEAGTISKDILIHELKTYRLVDQYLFHTDRALEFLKFKSAITIEK